MNLPWSFNKHTHSCACVLQLLATSTDTGCDLYKVKMQLSATVIVNEAHNELCLRWFSNVARGGAQGLMQAHTAHNTGHVQSSEQHFSRQSGCWKQSQTTGCWKQSQTTGCCKQSQTTGCWKQSQTTGCWKQSQRQAATRYHQRFETDVTYC